MRCRTDARLWSRVKLGGGGHDEHPVGVAAMMPGSGSGWNQERVAPPIGLAVAAMMPGSGSRVEQDGSVHERAAHDAAMMPGSGSRVERITPADWDQFITVPQ